MERRSLLVGQVAAASYFASLPSIQVDPTAAASSAALRRTDAAAGALRTTRHGYLSPPAPPPPPPRPPPLRVIAERKSPILTGSTNFTSPSAVPYLRRRCTSCTLQEYTHVSYPPSAVPSHAHRRLDRNRCPSADT